MKLLKNLSWILFANAFASLAKWLIVILIAKNLSPTEVGVYSLAFAIGAPVTLFANMKLRSLYITSNENNIKDYFYSRNFLSVIAMVVLLGISILIYPQYSVIILLVGFAKVLDLQSDLYYAIPHKNNELNVVGKLIIAKQSLLIIVFTIALLITNSLVYPLLTQIIVQAIFLIFMERRISLKNHKYIDVNVKLINVKKILMLGLPLGLVQMIFSFNSNYPRYVLEYFENPTVLGYFSAIMYIVTVFNLFMNSISQVFLPKLTNIFKSKDINKFKKYLYVYLSSLSVVLSVIIIGVSSVLGKTILALLYGIEYAAYDEILILISISVAINMFSWNFDTALMSMRYISIQPKITFFNLISTVVFGYFLISKFGIQGAAYTLIISAFTLLIMRAYFVNKKLYASNLEEEIVN